MDWDRVHSFDFFLFDFDGLLVDTERLHYEAYKNMLASHGYTLPWSYPEYALVAHYSSHGIREKLQNLFPDLFVKNKWEDLYRGKTEAFIHLVQAKEVYLMPGVDTFLRFLEENKKKSCIVTHSLSTLVEEIVAIHPILNTIAHRITREDYTHAKPHPDAYITALERYGTDSIAPIGFEDTPRGIRSLKETRAKPVMVTSVSYPEIPTFQKEGVLYLPDFEHLAAIF